jgi:hypothetical protein
MPCLNPLQKKDMELWYHCPPYPPTARSGLITQPIRAFNVRRVGVWKRWLFSRGIQAALPKTAGPVSLAVLARACAYISVLLAVKSHSILTSESGRV